MTTLQNDKLTFKKDNVSLFAISGDGAVVTFTVTRPEVRKYQIQIWVVFPEILEVILLFKVDVYNSDHGPFLYITQYKLATHLVTMDIETFTQLAESLPTQDIKVQTDIQNHIFEK